MSCFEANGNSSLSVKLKVEGTCVCVTTGILRLCKLGLNRAIALTL